MCNTRPILARAAAAVCGVAAAAALCVPEALHAQRYRDEFTRLLRIEPGTFITVRTTEYISSNRADDHVFPAAVAEDVWDDWNRLAVPAIPVGSPAELIVRTVGGGDLMLDLDSVLAHGQRYAVTAQPEVIESEQHLSRDAPGLIGGGAVLGTIIGAIAGGGKGAAIGAAAGAGTGAALSVRGRSVRVPAGSILNFRLERGMVVGVPRRGPDRDRRRFDRDRDFDRQSPPDRPPDPPDRDR